MAKTERDLSAAPAAHGNREITALSRGWRRVVPIAFIVLSLTALVVVPLLVRSYTLRLRHQMQRYIEPAEVKADQLQDTLAGELSTIISFQATEQAQYRAIYEEARRREAQLFDELSPLAPHVSPEFRAQLVDLRNRMNAWHTSVAESEFVTRSLPSPVFLYRMHDSQTSLEKSESAADNLKTAARKATEDRQEDIASAEQMNVRLSITLTLLALVSALLVIWLGRRMRILAAEAESRRVEAMTEAQRATAARSEAETAEMRSAFLAEASRELSTSLDERAVAHTVARMAVPELADLCIIDLAGPAGDLERMASFSRSENVDQHLTSQGAAYASDSMITRIASGRKVEIVRPLPEELAAALGPEEARPESALIAPLRVRKESLGLLILASLPGRRPFRADDVQVIQELAVRVALALDNARLYFESQQALRSREEILAIVSHDLRSPLTTITMTTSMLLDMPPDPKDVPEHLEAIRTSARRMNRLIKDLLDVTRIDSGHRLPIDPEPFDVHSLVPEILEIFRPQAQSRRIALFEDVPPEPFVIEADRDRLVQALSNLLGNAMKFTPEGGRVEFRLERRDSHAVFAVADTGPGIEPENLTSIFEPYWQMKRTARMGAGLGLPIAKGIVDAHGGSIRVESTPGSGTTFFVSIPVRQG